MLMTEPAETRESLLVRLRDGRCEQAWDEFAQIYRPMILRLARQSGLQDCDAQDVAQRVLISVARVIGTWHKDSEKGRFRGWLTTVTRNAVRNAVTRVPRDQLPGHTQLLRMLESDIDDSAALDRHIETEFRRAVFRAAAARVQKEFTESTWQAFWQTTVDEVSVVRAAELLNLSPGAIYAARSRVMRRLQQVTQTILAESDPS